MITKCEQNSHGDKNRNQRLCLCLALPLITILLISCGSIGIASCETVTDQALKERIKGGSLPLLVEIFDTKDKEIVQDILANEYYLVFAKCSEKYIMEFQPPGGADPNETYTDPFMRTHNRLESFEAYELFLYGEVIPYPFGN